MELHGIDLAVLLGYLVLALGLGLWTGRGSRDVSDFLLGGRHLPWWAILGSIVATETSTATFLSLPGRAFVEGGDLRFLQLGLGYVVGRVLVAATLLPGYFAGQITSVYQLLRDRFGGSTQRTASAIFLCTRTVADGLRLFLTALALEQVAGLPFALCVVALGLSTVVYTAVGGMRSIVWNDCLQLLVYVAGGLAALWFAVSALPGGVEQWLEFGRDTGRWRWFDPSLSLADADTFWAGLIGGAVLTLGVHGTDQMLVQRYLCARSPREAGLALIGSGFVVLLQFALFLALGVALAAYHAHLGRGADQAGDQVVAAFLVHELPAGTGLIGLMLAAVFAAMMSTLSSSLNSSASSLLEDWIRPLSRRALDERGQLRLLRALTVACGACQVTVALAARGSSQSVVGEVLAVAAFSAGLLLGLFALGALLPRADSRAATIGLAVGLVALLGVRFGLPQVGGLLAWPWHSLVGAGAVLAAGAVATLDPRGRRART